MAALLVKSGYQRRPVTSAVGSPAATQHCLPFSNPAPSWSAASSTPRRRNPSSDPSCRPFPRSPPPAGLCRRRPQPAPGASAPTTSPKSSGPKPRPPARPKSPAKSISSRIHQNVPQTASDRAFGGRVFFVSRLGGVTPQPCPPNAAPNQKFK
jgi:hypothetical protein